MARGNQRELARAKNLKKQADQVSPSAPIPLTIIYLQVHQKSSQSYHASQPIAAGLCLTLSHLAQAPTLPTFPLRPLLLPPSPNRLTASGTSLRADHFPRPTEKRQLKERKRDAARQRGCSRADAREAEEGYILIPNPPRPAPPLAISTFQRASVC